MTTPAPKGGAVIVPAPVAGGEDGGMKGGKRSASVKQLKRMLKSAGLKTTGRKAALTRRAKKAHLKLVKKGGSAPESTGGEVKQNGTPAVMGGRRSRRRGKLGLFGL